MQYLRQRGGDLYSESIGPLTTPRRVIDSILSGGIDVGPLDFYALDLLQRTIPIRRHGSGSLRRQTRGAIPFLVASRQCPDEVVTSLQAALMEFGEIAACDDLRGRLCLRVSHPS